MLLADPKNKPVLSDVNASEKIVSSLIRPPKPRENEGTERDTPSPRFEMYQFH